MKNTILSEKDAQIIEKVILKYGRIVVIGDLMGIFTKYYNKSPAHNRIQTLVRPGRILRVTSGLYSIV